MPKFYFTSIANRPMRLSGFTFRFEICSLHGGKAAGIYAAEREDEQAVLDDAVRGRRGVKEIGAEEYAELKKKLSQTPPSKPSNVFRPRVVQIPTLPEVAIEERAGVVRSADSGAAGKPAVNPEENLLAQPPISKLVRLERVNPPAPFAQATNKAVKAAQRADRAKIRVARKAE